MNFANIYEISKKWKTLDKSESILKQSCEGKNCRQMAGIGAICSKF